LQINILKVKEAGTGYSIKQKEDHKEINFSQLYGLPNFDHITLEIIDKSFFSRWPSLFIYFFSFSHSLRGSLVLKELT
jgi:hypothetical protein